MEERLKNRYSSAAFWLVAAFILLLEITGRSFCVDEAARLYDLTFGSLADTLASGVRDGQLLYLFAAYTWRMFFGHSEWVMRALNIPFAVIMLGYLRAILRQSEHNPWYALLLVIHPVFVQYIDEAGPFIMTGAAAAAFTYYALYAPQRDSTRTILLLNAAFLFGTASYGVFAFFYVVYAVQLVMRLRGGAISGAEAKRHLIGMGICLPIGCLVAVVLAYVGYQGGISGPGLLNLAEMAYCYLGFAGLGLSREELLEGKVALLTRQNILLIGMVVLAIAVIAAALVRRHKFKKLLMFRASLYIGTAAYLLLLWCGACLGRFMLLDQHIFPVMVPLVLFLADLITVLKISLAHRALQGAVILLVAMQMFSSFQLRTVARYIKDDYRTAAEKICDTSNLERATLLTSGFNEAWRFYGISPQDGSEKPQPEGCLPSVDVNGYSVQQLETLLGQVTGPVILVLNEESVPAETYAWKGHGNCREQRVNDLRILWVNY